MHLLVGRMPIPTAARGEPLRKGVQTFRHHRRSTIVGRSKGAKDRRFSQGRTGIIFKLGKAWQLPSSVSAGIRKGATAEAKIVQVDGSLD
jgi:hypothetical protein